jgi:hypothetical protein
MECLIFEKYKIRSTQNYCVKIEKRILIDFKNEGKKLV